MLRNYLYHTNRIGPEEKNITIRKIIIINIITTINNKNSIHKKLKTISQRDGGGGGFVVSSSAFLGFQLLTLLLVFICFHYKPI
jgi:hypothetical protein